MLKCQISNIAYQKLRAYVSGVGAEISGIGKTSFVKSEGDDIIVIDDVVIFKQKVTGSNTVLEDSAQSEFMNELMIKGEDLSSWNLWWHSHHTMNVFWSSTDTGTMEQHAGSMPYLVSLVTNLKDEFKVRLDVFESNVGNLKIKNHQYIDDIETFIMAKDLIESEIEYVETLTTQSSELLSEKETLIERVKELSNEIEKINNSIDEVNGFVVDKQVEVSCKKEIEEKVTKPIITHYNDYHKKDYSYYGKKYIHQIGFGEHDPYPDYDLDFSYNNPVYSEPFVNTEDVNEKMKSKLLDISFSIYMDEEYVNNHYCEEEEPSEDFNVVNKSLSK